MKHSGNKDKTLTALFVYGTLKRKQIREQCWPFPPKRVRTATVLAEMYDLGPYPALIAGCDSIAGEIWEFTPDQMEKTLSVIDEVEGCPVLYTRVKIECELNDGLSSSLTQGSIGAETCWAYTYFYTDVNRLKDQGSRVQPVNGVCQWP